MASYSITWTDGSPEQLARTLKSIADKVPEVVFDAAQSEASRAEAWMKEKAPWKDQTGEARQGLFGKAEKDGLIIEMALGHTMEYGPYLELGTKRSKPYRIVIPAYRLSRIELMRGINEEFTEMFLP